MKLKKIIFIVGPTAVGKTSLALLLAKKIKGEIISCDAMQVYKEVNIASNKPSPKIRQLIPHHLIDVVSISKSYNVVAFRKTALKTIRNIHRKNKIPIIVGGSGLYMNVLLDGIFEGAKKDLKLRLRLQKEAEEKGREFLYERLKRLDLKAAQKIHPNDTKRIIRALEVYLINKKPISQLQKKRQGLWGKYDIKIFALVRSRARLYERINERVERMFEDGLVDEMKNLLKRPWSPTASALIGVKEVKGFLKGEYNLERAKYLMKLHTRRYAKRQLTWFRKDKRLHWINLEEHDKLSLVVARLMKEIGG